MSDSLLVLRLAVGIVFGFSAFAKLEHPRRFVEGVVAYELLPHSMSTVVAWLLIPLEIALALTHLFGWWLPIVAPVTIATLLAFMAAASRQLWRGQAASCYCFNASGDELISVRTLIRILLLVASEVMLIGWLLPHGQDASAAVEGFDMARWTLAAGYAIVLLNVGRWLLASRDAIRIWRLT